MLFTNVGVCIHKTYRYSMKNYPFLQTTIITNVYVMFAVVSSITSDIQKLYIPKYNINVIRLCVFIIKLIIQN